ncbi:MAG: glycosyltransferase family 4 protein [Chloroflexota bacterium]
MLLENNPYPQDSRVRKEADTLADAGYDVSVVCQRAADQPLVEDMGGVTVYRYPAVPELGGFFGYLLEYGYAFIAALFYTCLIALTRGFDVIHAHNPPEIYVFIAKLFRPFGKKFVFDHHDLSPDVYMAKTDGKGSRTLYKILRWMERITLREADHILATNHSYKMIEMERANLIPEKITVVRNGPSLDRFSPQEPDPAIRSKAKYILGYAGEMHKQDGLDFLMRALAHLYHDIGETDFLCLFMGNGSEIPNLKQQAVELGIADRVEFTGRLRGEEFIRHLASTHICLDPDPYNSFNNHSTMIKIPEYMAMEKPIVAFDLTEHRYSAQEAAIYIPDNDEMLFAKGIAMLSKDPVLRERMGKFGRNRVEMDLSWEHSARNLVKAYEMVLPLKKKVLAVVA